MWRAFVPAAAQGRQQVRYLSRDEIAGHGIDRRGFQETRWTTADTRRSPLAVSSS